MNEKIYQFGKSKLVIRFGDITESNTGAIVSSDDNYLTMGGGVSLAILRAGGNSIANDARKQVPTNLGDVIVTSAGNLASKFIFHAITIDRQSVEQVTIKDVIKSIVDRCFMLLGSLDLNSISFPAIGAGVARFDLVEVATQMSITISKHLYTLPKEVVVVIYLMDRYNKMTPIDYISFFEQFYARLYEEGHIVKEVDAKNDPVIPSSENKEEDIRSMRIHHLRRLLNSLEEQRRRLENRWVELIDDPNDEEKELLKKKLSENDEIRIPRQKELRDIENRINDKSATKEVKTVFISSTFEDLKDYRKEVINQIVLRQMIPNCMEQWGAVADDRRPASFIVDKVRDSDVYLGIFGQNYGYVDESTGLSMTELEYLEAKALNKPILIYILNQPVANIDDRLQRLLDELKTNRVVGLFKNQNELSVRVFQDLEQLLEK